ncbi:MAG: sensor protein lytS, partial [Bacteroidota bacterium]|nr:sensor protein lytS [Bacteroidota bacterium]
MLKTRFTSGLNLELCIDDQYKQHLLPALTLQLLVENAMKHNSVEKEKPLTISISTTKEGRLCIRNNLQSKMNDIPSTGVG